MGVKLSAFAADIKKRFQALGKLQYAILLMAAGLFMMLPVRQNTAGEEAVAVMTESSALPELSMEEQIAQLLSQVEGAGNARVMLTVQHDGETEYQVDREESSSGTNRDIRLETVFGRGETEPVIRSRSAPVYRGAVVLCQGADSAVVRYRVTKAVCSLTGLGSDKVTVLKMKTNN